MRKKVEKEGSNSEGQKWNYDSYTFRWKDWLEYGVRLAVKMVVICYLFYDTWKMCFLLFPIAIVDYFQLKKNKLEQQQRELTLQFRSMIEAIATGLSAGYSLERAVAEAKEDLILIYSEKSIIIQELNTITAGLKVNIPIEHLLQSFGKRSGVDDIANFASVVSVAKKSGGNLVRIIQKTINSITDKIAVEEEIATMIASRKYEEKIMMIMPYGIILYLRLTDGGYFDVLYHNLLGVILMTIFLFVIQLADIWAKKIMEIRV